MSTDSAAYKKKLKSLSISKNKSKRVKIAQSKRQSTHKEHSLLSTAYDNVPPPPPPADMDLETFINSTRKSFAKPFDNLPTHKDLPRLIKCATIIDENTDKQLFSFENESDYGSRYEACCQFLAVLSERMDTPEQAEWIKLNFPTFNDQKDMETHLNKFFVALQATSHPLTILPVLKCCNQELPYGAIGMMKSNIGTKYAYRDIRGTWKISIIFSHEGRVTVVHHKIEQSVDEESEKYFQYEWRLNFGFLPDLSSFVPILQITNYDFGAQMPAETKKDILRLFSPIMANTTPYYRIWKKTLTSSTDIQKDISHFAPKVRITNEHGKKLWVPDKNKLETELVKDLISNLGIHLGETSTYIDEFIEAISAKMVKKEAFKTGDSPKGRLRRNSRTGGTPTPTLTTATQSAHESDGIIITKLWAVLKCLSSEIHQPALTRMREAFFDSLPFRDVKRSWQIHIQINSKGPITIIHRMIEESPNLDYNFEWLLIFTVGKSSRKIEQVDFRINDFGFPESASEETRHMVKACLKPFYHPRDDIRINLDFDRTLSVIIDRIKELPRINAFHPDLPHSIDLLQLLIHLQQTPPSHNLPLTHSDTTPSPPTTPPRESEDAITPSQTPSSPSSPISLIRTPPVWSPSYSRSPGNYNPRQSMLSNSAPLSPPLILSTSRSATLISETGEGLGQHPQKRDSQPLDQ